jgi:glycosyltransferase involved in cell wall biosynthesis
MGGILQVIQQGQLRGAEVFALDLARTLSRQRGWRVSVLSLFAVEPAYLAAARDVGLTVAAVNPRGTSRGFDLRLAWQLRAIIEAGRYRLVQANGAATLKYLVVARRLARGAWPLVYRAIGFGSFWRRGRLRRWAYRWLLRQPDAVVAVCRAVAEDLLATGVRPARLHVVPNGVEPARLARRPADGLRVRASLGIPPGESLLLYVGSLAEEKNLPALVDVVAACRREGIAAHALFVGDGPAHPSLVQAAARLDVAAAVHVRPADQAIGPYLDAADLFVLPSTSEGMPAVLIEAGLAGLPAVASAVGGVPEVVQDGVTGRLVPPGDQAALAAAVRELLTDPQRRQAMGLAARLRYRRFEIAPIADSYGALYDRLLDGQRPR